jgi:nitrite reductase (NADH) large subunit
MSGVVVVVGNGMVGHHFTQQLLKRRGQWLVHIFGDEPHPAYDRVNLSRLFAAPDEDLSLPGPWAGPVATYTGEEVVSADRARRLVTSSAGRVVAYDRLVLATGARAVVPPLAGTNLQGWFVYRTRSDLLALRQALASARRAVVLGGGPLGMEAAVAFRQMGVETHLVECAGRLMARELDETAADLLRVRLASAGIVVHLGRAPEALVGASGRVRSLRFADGSSLVTDLVLLATGVRPRDQIARAAGLEVAPSGGVVIDEGCRTSDPTILAVGDCAHFRGRSPGTIAPGYRMAEVAAAGRCGERQVLAEIEAGVRLERRTG